MVSKTPDLDPFQLDAKREYLTPPQVQTLKKGTLQLLETVGVRFPSARALEIFADHGARVDKKTQVVKIPPDLVMKAMYKAPRSFVLAGRTERFDLTLDGQNAYLCTEGCGVHVLDPQTGRVRPSSKKDVELAARISDALPMIGFYWPLITAQDCGVTAPLHDCHAGLTSTLKHVRGGTTMPPYLAAYIVETALVAAGSKEALRRRPPINANICTIAPLCHDPHGIEAALTYAGAGIPVSFMAMPTMGSTAPASALGALVVGDAEVVSGMVLLQLAFPGTPVFHSVLVSMMEPRTGGYIAEHTVPTKQLSVQLGHAWGVPSLGGGGVATDAPDLGWQCGIESALGSVFIALGGAEICGHLGMTDGAMIFHPSKLILDHHLCAMARELMQAFTFEPEDLPLDVIKQVGPGGHFLMEPHTVRHVRGFNIPDVLHKKDDEGALKDPLALAKAQFDHLDRHHHPEPLAGDKKKELDRILAAADREARRRA